MSMTGMSMATTATASSMAMASTASSMNMGSDGGQTMSMMTMTMEEMMMVFFTSTATPLFSMQWAPQSTGQYAGTCIFLIALATLFRGLLAIRSSFSFVAAIVSLRRETHLLRDGFDKKSDDVPVAAAKPARRRPWSINRALSRAVLDTVLAGVSYLLMLAVMTMNVGYFMSVLGGTFLGSFVFGNWTVPAAH